MATIADTDPFDSLIDSLPDHGDLVIADLNHDDYRTCPEDVKESIRQPIAETFWSTCVDEYTARSRFWSRVNERKPQSLLFRACLQTHAPYKLGEDAWYKCWTRKLDGRKRRKTGRLDVVVPTVAPPQQAQPVYPQAQSVYPAQYPPQQAPHQADIGGHVLLGHICNLQNQALGIEKTLQTMNQAMNQVGTRLQDIEGRVAAVEERLGVVLDVLEHSTKVTELTAPFYFV